MEQARLTLQGVEIRAVSVPLKRPIVSKVGSFDALAADPDRPFHATKASSAAATSSPI